MQARNDGDDDDDIDVMVIMSYPVDVSDVAKVPLFNSEHA